MATPDDPDINSEWRQSTENMIRLYEMFFYNPPPGITISDLVKLNKEINRLKTLYFKREQAA
jgi:hypothetical protein